MGVITRLKGCDGGGECCVVVAESYDILGDAVAVLFELGLADDLNDEVIHK